MVHTEQNTASFQADDLKISTLQSQILNNPDDLQLLVELATLLSEKNHHPQSIILWEKILIQQPHNPEVHYNLANAYYHLQEYEKASYEYQFAIHLSPNHSNSYNNLASIFAFYDNIDKAEELYKKSLELNSKQSQPYINLINIGLQTKNIQKSLDYLQQAALCFKGVPPELLDAAQLIFQEINQQISQGPVKQTIAFYLKFIDLFPNHAEAYANLGCAYLETEQLKECIVASETSLRLGTQDSAVYNNLAIAYFKEDNLNKCFEYLHAGLNHAPQEDTLLHRLALAFRTSGQLILAKKIFEARLKSIIEYHQSLNDSEAWLFPVSKIDVECLAIYAYICRELCCWKEATLACNILQYLLNLGTVDMSAIPPMTTLILFQDISDQKYFTKIYSERLAAKATFQYKHEPKTKPSKLKIGYFSADFFEHPVGYLIHDLFRHHDRDNFEIYSYYTNKYLSPATKIIEDSSDYFRSLYSLTASDAAEVIYQDGIDILIDLSGYTYNSRTYIFAYRPARIQGHFCGYPSSLQADFIDYHLTHAEAIPENCAAYYSEKLVYLPETAIATTLRKPQVSMPTRADLGLPEDAFVFCYLGQSYRIDEEAFSAWMEILSKTSNSVLWLTGFNPHVKNQLENSAEKMGISKNRLIFRSPALLSADWSHAQADLWLDTFVISAGTSSILCAAAGLPLLCVAGPVPCSRTSSWIAQAQKFTDLVCCNRTEYIEKAIQLATDKSYFDTTKKHLNESKNSSPLFNPSRFSSHLELAYHAMWENSHSEQPNNILHSPLLPIESQL